MDWFLFVSFIMATPLFAADTLHSLEVERAEVLERRSPINLRDALQRRPQLQEARDRRYGALSTHRIKTIQDVEVQMKPTIRGHRPGPFMAWAPDQRPSIRLDQVRSMATEIQAKRDARLGEKHEVRTRTMREVVYQLEIAPYVRGRAFRQRRKVHSNFLPKVSK